MKLLLFVTGRGIGGDAVLAYNTSKILEKRGVETKIVLDESAQGLYFKRHDMTWLTNPIPTAGGHAASKLSLLKAGLKTLSAGRQGSKLLKKEQADGVIGILGGGTVIGCLSAKMAKLPAVGMVATPTDTKMSMKWNDTLILPESPLFTKGSLKSDHVVERQYIPIVLDIIKGSKEEALKRLPDNYDPSKPSVLFSSGSTLFDGMAKAARKYAEENDDVNIFVIGYPLKDELNSIIDHPNIMNLSYVDWISDLYKLVDVVITTDDGLTLHETLACEIPIVVVIGVKYGRYHNLASVFDGAVLESNVDNITEKVTEALDNNAEMKKAAHKYSVDIINTPDYIGDFIINSIKKNKKE